VIRNISLLLHPLPQYVQRFIKDDFKLVKYAFVGVFLGISIGINYSLDFETNYVANFEIVTRFIKYTGFYGFAYFSGVFIIRIFDKNWTYLKSSSFWFLSITGILIITSTAAFKDVYSITKDLVGEDSYFFVGRLLSESRYFITIFLPLVILWVLIRDPNEPFFGLTKKNIIFKPYLFLLLLMVPLIVLAAQNPSFLEKYPLFKSFGIEHYWNVGMGWIVVMYEFVYAASFFSIELFYRGFLVIGLAKIMGKDVIIPMVCLYAFLHFEKPIGEAVSSIFGGYLLGIFAYYSKNIWGGVFVHVGIALLMEIIAAFVKM
jgi:CAAX prenyl protease-like protein